MKDLIVRILREEGEDYHQKFINQIDKIGLINFLNLTKFSYTKLWSMIGDEWITRKIKEKFIKDVMEDLEWGFGISEVGEKPIGYKENETEFWQIDYIGLNTIAVDIISKETGEEQGSFNLRYSQLDDSILDRIFDIVVMVYESNK